MLFIATKHFRSLVNRNCYEQLQSVLGILRNFHICSLSLENGKLLKWPKNLKFLAGPLFESQRMFYVIFANFQNRAGPRLLWFPIGRHGQLAGLRLGVHCSSKLSVITNCDDNYFNSHLPRRSQGYIEY